MIILVDSREQAPYDFARYGAATETATLPVGDYSLPGFEDRVSIERKPLDDLVGCLMGKDLERFEKELARARHYDLFCVVIEAPLFLCIPGQISQRLTPPQRPTEPNYLSSQIPGVFRVGWQPEGGRILGLLDLGEVS